jgi:hypothetical protein
VTQPGTCWYGEPEHQPAPAERPELLPQPHRHVVSTDGSTPGPRRSRGGSDPKSTRPAGRDGLEVAQRVWHRSLELAGTGSDLHLPDHALALARTAGHDLDTMAHALGLGRSQARHPSNGEPTRRGVRLLERAIGYLGVRPVRGDIATTGRRRGAIPRARVTLSICREGQHHTTDNDRRALPTPAGRPSPLMAEPVPLPEPVPPPEPAPPPEPVPPPEPMLPPIPRPGGTPVLAPRLLESYVASSEPTRGGDHADFS